MRWRVRHRQRMDIPAQLDFPTQEQDGLLRRRQLLDAGVTPGQIRWRLGRTWRAVLPDVYLMSTKLPTPHQRMIAALLYAGPKAWLSGPTAAYLHGLTAQPASAQVHVLVPAPQTPRDVDWASIRRTHLTDERLLRRGPLTFSCAARAVVDAAAAAADDGAARALVIGAVQRRLARLDDVAHWVNVRQPNGSVVLRRALNEAAAGAWSVPEADVLALLRASSALPPVWANPWLFDADGRRLTTPDAWFDDVALAVMVHSRQFHADALDWDATVTQDSDLSAAGVIVLGVTPAALTRDPARVLARVVDAHRKAAARGHRAPVHAVPRSDRDLGLVTLSPVMSPVVSPVVS